LPLLKFQPSYFRKTPSNFTKIRPLGAELFLAVGRTEGQTNTHIERQTWWSYSRFSQFCERA